jgi:uncharacterized protein (DUF58 family)
MIGKTIAAAAAVLALGLWAMPAQAIDIELSSPDEGATVYPGDEVEMTVSVTNDWTKKDIIHIRFELTADIGGEPVLVGTAKRRIKLPAGETLVETMGAVVPDLPFTGQAEVTIEGTAVGKKSKDQDTDTLLLTVESPLL